MHVYFGLLIGVPHKKANIHELVEADWLGIIGMSIGLSCMTIVLEEGQRDQWFDSSVIRTLSVFAVLGLTTLGITQFTSKRPVLKLKLLKNYTYASVILIVITIGMVLYNILYVLPQFLSGVAGYNSFQSGWILALSGLPAFARWGARVAPADFRLLLEGTRLTLAGACVAGAPIDLATPHAGHAGLLTKSHEWTAVLTA